MSIFRWVFSSFLLFFLICLVAMIIFSLRSILTNVTTYQRMKNRFLNKTTVSGSDLASNQSEEFEYEKL